MDKMKDKARYKDVDPRERHYDRGPAPRMREGDREWRERERRLEDDRSRNGRPMSHAERGTDREVEREVTKGDTFPRMRKSTPERGRRMMSSDEMDEEKRERRQRDRPRRTEADDWEREREKARQREKYREMERAQDGGKRGGRPVEDDKLRQRERYQGPDSFQDRSREVGESWDRREKDATRKREKPRPNMGEREARVPSPRRRRDRDNCSDWKERGEAPRREGKRDTKSEGDSDEREFRRERARVREREELTYQHSRSEGDDMGRRTRERDQNRQEYWEEDRQRYRDREREVDRSRRRGVEKDRERPREDDRRAGREAEREGERWKESGRDLKDDKAWSNDRREGDRYREYEQKRHRERKEREADPRWDGTSGRSSRSPNKTAPRVPPRAQSSGEWSSDMDGETRHRSRGRDSFEERESGRESTTESERDVEEQRDRERAAERRHREQKRSDRQERDRGQVAGSMPEQRRMWLEPQRGKNSKDEFVDRERETRRKERRREEEKSAESQDEWGREGQPVQEEPDEKYLNQSGDRQRRPGRSEYREYRERETEGVSVDEEEVWGEADKTGREHLSDSNSGTEGSQQRDAEGESMTDNTEESDREEEGGLEHVASSRKSRNVSGWKQDRDSMLSTEDGFVTVSSGADEEDERNEEEDEFEDCQEFWGGRDAHDRSPPVGSKGCEGGEERRDGELTVDKEEKVDEEDQEKEQGYVFYVVGQTLPRSKPNDVSPSHVDQIQSVERGDANAERCQQDSDDVTLRPQDDLHATVSRNDEVAVTDKQNSQGKSQRDTPREESVATGETAEVDVRYRASSEHQDTETGERTKSKVEHPYDEIGPINRDSQTERLLLEWREKSKELEQFSSIPRNPYPVCSPADLEKIKPLLEGINTGAMSPEEVEAIRIRLSGAWSMSEEPKRHSQAPHLKWAKNVVREILGRSEEHVADEPNSKEQGDHEVNPSEMMVIQDDQEQEEVSGGTDVKSTSDEQPSEPELEDEEPLVVVGLRGMGQNQADMHADPAMHGDTPTHTHADTPLDTEGQEEHSPDKETEPPGHLHVEKEDAEIRVSEQGGNENTLSEIEREASGQKEVEMYLTVSNTLYKPNSCPILNYGSNAPSREGESKEEEDRVGQSDEERQGGEPDDRDAAVEVGRVGEEGEGVDSRKGEKVAEKPVGGGTLTSTCSFRDLGPEARIRRRGIRKTTERRGGGEELVEVEDEEGVAGDRRPRIFSTAGKTGD